MKYYPMLFNTQMVREIRSGNKTQTRRLIKGIPLYEPYATEEDGKLIICDENGDWFPAERFSRIQEGDILWVRETYCKDAGRYMYRADYSDDEKFYVNGHETRVTWRPSIHMPKEAARSFLLVTGVCTERLKDMTPEDCMRDGGFSPEAVNLLGVEILFGSLWDSTIKEADLNRHGWFANPWVYVYDFLPVSKPKGWMNLA